MAKPIHNIPGEHPFPREMSEEMKRWHGANSPKIEDYKKDEGYAQYLDTMFSYRFSSMSLEEWNSNDMYPSLKGPEWKKA